MKTGAGSTNHGRREMLKIYNVPQVRETLRYATAAEAGAAVAAVAASLKEYGVRWQKLLRRDGGQ